MNKTAKLFLGCILATLTFFSFNIGSVKAATGSFSISSASTATVGSTFSVTIKASASKMFYWQFYVTYSSKLKLVSGSTTIQGEADDATLGTSSVSRTLKFKALSTGSATISVARGDADMNIDADFNTISYAKISKNISIVDAVAKSTNANLASITPSAGTLSPAFSADTTGYTVDVNTLIDTITLDATLADSKATVAGNGVLTVSEGANNFNITVTAENGATKVYNVIVNVVDANPITIKIDKASYTIIKKASALTIPANYIATTTSISDTDVVAYENETNKLVLVGLKDKDGNAAFYVYNKKDNTYTKYNEIVAGATKLYIFSPSSKTDIPDGYKAKTLTIDKVDFDAWQLKGNSDKDFYLVYGTNVDTGDTGFYTYDKIDKTFQRFIDGQFSSLTEKNNQLLIFAIITSTLALVFIGLSMFQFIKNKKRKKA